MLCLTRSPGEEIWIDGGRIRITITRIHGQMAVVGVDAPGMVIDRKEVHERRIANKERKPNDAA